MVVHTQQVEVPDVTLQHSDRDLTVEVYRDQHPPDPMATEFVVNVACSHGRYDLGNDDLDTDAHGSWSEIEQDIRERHEVVSMTPLYLYDHSGITISTTPFRGRWDSGQVGFAYVTESDTNNPDANWDDIIEDTIQRYDNYLRGNIYRYVVIEDGEEVDSCAGFFDVGRDAECDRMWEHIGHDRDEFEVTDRA